MAYKVSIKQSLCIGCGNCAEACPPTTARKNKAIEEGETINSPVLEVKQGNCRLEDEDGCGLCGVCVVACPSGAIKIKEEV